MTRLIYFIYRSYNYLYIRLSRYFWLNVVRNSVGTVGDNLHVNARTLVTKNTILGNNVNFNGMDIRGQGKVEIGDNFHSGTDCLIITDIHNYEGNKIPYDETYIVKNVTIENNVWIGTGVTILGGVTIGEGAIIQAGSVVVKDISRYMIAGGHPAKEFSQRNIEKYELHKKNKNFL